MRLSVVFRNTKAVGAVGILLLVAFLVRCGINNPRDIQSPTSPISNGTDQIVRNVYVTFYGYDDNDDGSGHFGNAVISDPVIHPIATEEVGSYEHPSTFATDYAIARPGQLIYVPKLRKYYVMEDTCAECSAAQKASKTRVDLYMGGNTVRQGGSLTQCENSLTDAPYTDVIIVNPKKDWPVSTAPLFSSGVCQSSVFPVP